MRKEAKRTGVAAATRCLETLVRQNVNGQVRRAFWKWSCFGTVEELRKARKLLSLVREPGQPTDATKVWESFVGERLIMMQRRFLLHKKRVCFSKWHQSCETTWQQMCSQLTPSKLMGARVIAASLRLCQCKQLIELSKAFHHWSNFSGKALRHEAIHWKMEAKQLHQEVGQLQQQVSEMKKETVAERIFQGGERLRFLFQALDRQKTRNRFFLWKLYCQREQTFFLQKSCQRFGLGSLFSRRRRQCQSYAFSRWHSCHRRAQLDTTALDGQREREEHRRRLEAKDKGWALRQALQIANKGQSLVLARAFRMWHEASVAKLQSRLDGLIIAERLLVRSKGRSISRSFQLWQRISTDVRRQEDFTVTLRKSIGVATMEKLVARWTDHGVNRAFRSWQSKCVSASWQKAQASLEKSAGLAQIDKLLSRWRNRSVNRGFHSWRDNSTHALWQEEYCLLRKSAGFATLDKLVTRWSSHSVHRGFHCWRQKCTFLDWQEEESSLRLSAGFAALDKLVTSRSNHRVSRAFHSLRQKCTRIQWQQEHAALRHSAGFTTLDKLVTRWRGHSVNRGFHSWRHKCAHLHWQEQQSLVRQSAGLATLDKLVTRWANHSLNKGFHSWHQKSAHIFLQEEQYFFRQSVGLESLNKLLDNWSNRKVNKTFYSWQQKCVNACNQEENESVLQKSAGLSALEKVLLRHVHQRFRSWHQSCYDIRRQEELEHARRTSACLVTLDTLAIRMINRSVHKGFYLWKQSCANIRRDEDHSALRMSGGFTVVQKVWVTSEGRRINHAFHFWHWQVTVHRERGKLRQMSLNSGCIVVRKIVEQRMLHALRMAFRCWQSHLEGVDLTALRKAKLRYAFAILSNDSVRLAFDTWHQALMDKKVVAKALKIFLDGLGSRKQHAVLSFFFRWKAETISIRAQQSLRRMHLKSVQRYCRKLQNFQVLTALNTWYHNTKGLISVEHAFRLMEEKTLKSKQISLLGSSWKHWVENTWEMALMTRLIRHWSNHSVRKGFLLWATFSQIRRAKTRALKELFKVFKRLSETRMERALRRAWSILWTNAWRRALASQSDALGTRLVLSELNGVVKKWRSGQLRWAWGRWYEVVRYLKQIETLQNFTNEHHATFKEAVLSKYQVGVGLLNRRFRFFDFSTTERAWKHWKDLAFEEQRRRAFAELVLVRAQQCERFAAFTRLRKHARVCSAVESGCTLLDRFEARTLLTQSLKIWEVFFRTRQSVEGSLRLLSKVYKRRMARKAFHVWAVCLQLRQQALRQRGAVDLWTWISSRAQLSIKRRWSVWRAAAGCKQLLRRLVWVVERTALRAGWLQWKATVDCAVKFDKAGRVLEHFSCDLRRRLLLLCMQRWTRYLLQLRYEAARSDMVGGRWLWFLTVISKFLESRARRAVQRAFARLWLHTIQGRHDADYNLAARLILEANDRAAASRLYYLWSKKLGVVLFRRFLFWKRRILQLRRFQGGIRSLGYMLWRHHCLRALWRWDVVVNSHVVFDIRLSSMVDILQRFSSQLLLQEAFARLQINHFILNPFDVALDGSNPEMTPPVLHHFNTYGQPGNGHTPNTRRIPGLPLFSSPDDDSQDSGYSNVGTVLEDSHLSLGVAPDLSESNTRSEFELWMSNKIERKFDNLTNEQRRKAMKSWMGMSQSHSQIPKGNAKEDTRGRRPESQVLDV